MDFKNWCLFLIGSASLILLSGCTSPPKAHWAEEFEGATLSEDNWNLELGDGCPQLCGWGNNEAQIYTSANHRLEDGKLIITARKEDSLYTSARISTQGKMKFQYGRLEVRAKLPKGKGIWPAIWLLGSNIGEVGWPRCGEIDILEYVGKAPGEVFTSLHTQNSHGNTINTRTTQIEGIEEDFHLFALEWEPDGIEFFVDGRPVYRFAPEDRTEEIWPFDQPFFVIINLAVGGNFGGPEIDESVFPQEFIIDYIRIFNYK